MRVDYDESLSRVLVHEGGYTNHPRDPGGPTNYGITIFDARKYAAEFGWIKDRDRDGGRRQGHAALVREGGL
jgi:lysozyme family protein